VRPRSDRFSALAVLRRPPPSGFDVPQAVQVDASIPEYKVVQGVSAAIKSVGSDTMINLMTSGPTSFKKLYPSVTVEIEGKGSAPRRRPDRRQPRTSAR
jgi:ABC-type phosphate transport system substrate-binding protein